MSSEPSIDCHSSYAINFDLNPLGISDSPCLCSLSLLKSHLGLFEFDFCWWLHLAQFLLVEHSLYCRCRLFYPWRWVLALTDVISICTAIKTCQKCSCISIYCSIILWDMGSWRRCNRIVKQLSFLFICHINHTIRNYSWLVHHSFSLLMLGIGIHANTIFVINYFCYLVFLVLHLS